MPYQSAPNSGMTEAANALTRIFVGDPAADAKYRDQQIKNETELLRQQMLQEQTISEGVRRQQMEAAAAASYASAGANNKLADGRKRENDAHVNLGKVFTKDNTNYAQPGGMSVPGDSPAGTPGKNFSLQAAAPEILSNIMTGGIDPKMLSAVAIMPGVQDADIGRLMTGSGKLIGKDEYVSTEDRNTNRNYELGAGERLIGGDGQQKAGVDPTYAAANAALVNQRNSAAAYNTTRANSPAGGKTPKLDAKEMNRMLRDAILSHGGAYDTATELPATYFSGQPEVYTDLASLIDQAYATSGGRASAVQDALGQYFNGVDLSQFRVNSGASDFIPFNEGKMKYNPIQRPDVQAILQRLVPPQQQPVIDPAMFTGGDAGLPDLQNVGNGGGWKVLGVENPGGR